MCAQMTGWRHGMLFALFSITLQAHAEEPMSVTVCDLFKDIASSSGKLIAVRGEVYISDEILAVGSRSCSNTISSDGHKWPTAIWLDPATVTDRGFNSTYSRSVEFMRGLTMLIVNTYQSGAQVMPPPVRIVATFIGTLRTTCPRCTGRGHLGYYPAEMVYIAVRDIEMTGLPPKAVP